MALYEYRCPCGKILEERFPLGTAPREVVCSCGQVARRLYRGMPVIFRPSGWDRSPEDPRYWDGLVEAEREKIEKPSILKR